VARTKKRRKSRSRAARFFLLAALTLLIAGFIARRQIPILMRPSRRPAPAPVSEGRENLPDLAGPGENLHAPAVSASPDRSAEQLAAHLRKDLSVRARQGSPHEEITGAERQRLGDLIKERSR
jgi:hypothetical protein